MHTYIHTNKNTYMKYSIYTNTNAHKHKFSACSHAVRMCVATWSQLWLGWLGCQSVYEQITGLRGYWHYCTKGQRRRRRSDDWEKNGKRKCRRERLRKYPALFQKIPFGIYCQMTRRSLSWCWQNSTLILATGGKQKSQWLQTYILWINLKQPVYKALFLVGLHKQHYNYFMPKQSLQRRTRAKAR